MSTDTPNTIVDRLLADEVDYDLISYVQPYYRYDKITSVGANSVITLPAGRNSSQVQFVVPSGNFHNFNKSWLEFEQWYKVDTGVEAKKMPALNFKAEVKTRKGLTLMETDFNYELFMRWSRDNKDKISDYVLGPFYQDGRYYNHEIKAEAGVYSETYH